MEASSEAGVGVLVDLSESINKSVYKTPQEVTKTSKLQNTNLLVDISTSSLSCHFSHYLQNNEHLTTKKLEEEAKKLKDQLTPDQHEEILEEAKKIIQEIESRQLPKIDDEDHEILDLEKLDVFVEAKSYLILKDEYLKNITSTPTERVVPGVVEHFRGAPGSPSNSRSASTISMSSNIGGLMLSESNAPVLKNKNGGRISDKQDISKFKSLKQPLNQSKSSNQGKQTVQKSPIISTNHRIPNVLEKNHELNIKKPIDDKKQNNNNNNNIININDNNKMSVNNNPLPKATNNKYPASSSNNKNTLNLNKNKIINCSKEKIQLLIKPGGGRRLESNEHKLSLNSRNTSSNKENNIKNNNNIINNNNNNNNKNNNNSHNLNLVSSSTKIITNKIINNNINSSKNSIDNNKISINTKNNTNNKENNDNNNNHNKNTNIKPKTLFLPTPSPKLRSRPSSLRRSDKEKIIYKRPLSNNSGKHITTVAKTPVNILKKNINQNKNDDKIELNRNKIDINKYKNSKPPVRKPPIPTSSSSNYLSQNIKLKTPEIKSELTKSKKLSYESIEGRKNSINSNNNHSNTKLPIATKTTLARLQSVKNSGKK